MCELATLGLAVSTVPAKRHVGVLEVAVRVCAVREEPANLLRLMSGFDGRGWVTASAFSVLASGAKGADVGNINGRAFGGDGGLVCEGTILARAAEIEATDTVGITLILLAIHGSIHLDVAIFSTTTLMLVSTAALETSPTATLWFNAVK